MTVPEVADYLRVSERQAWQWVSDGTIPSIKIGRLRRVSREALVTFARNGT